MAKKGKELEFISWIKRDGSGTEKVSEKYIAMLQEDAFDIRCLSMTEKTFIASGLILLL